MTTTKLLTIEEEIKKAATKVFIVGIPPHLSYEEQYYIDGATTFYARGKQDGRRDGWEEAIAYLKSPEYWDLCYLGSEASDELKEEAQRLGVIEKEG